MDLPREAIGHKGSICFCSRISKETYSHFRFSKWAGSGPLCPLWIRPWIRSKLFARDLMEATYTFAAVKTFKIRNASHQDWIKNSRKIFF